MLSKTEMFLHYEISESRFKLMNIVNLYKRLYGMWSFQKPCPRPHSPHTNLYSVPWDKDEHS